MDLRLTVVPADQVPWEHLERVLVARGDGQRCWCQWFRTRRDDWVCDAAATRAQALRSQAAGQGDATGGLVAYLGDEPVGWVAVAPREDRAQSHGASVVEAYTKVLQADGPTSRDLLAEAGFVAAEVPGLPRAFRLTL